MNDSSLFGRVVLVSGPGALLAERAVDRLVRQALAERPTASVTKVEAGELDAGGLVEVDPPLRLLRLQRIRLDQPMVVRAEQNAVG